MIQCKIITPDSLVFDGQAESVILPGSEGSLGILEDHAPIVTLLKKGVMEIESANACTRYEISGGFAEVKNNVIMIFVDSLK